MPLISPHLPAITHEQIEKQLTAIAALSSTTLGGWEKIIALNFNLARLAFERATARSALLWSASDAQTLLSSAEHQPPLDSLLAYGRELAEIAGATREQLLQALAADNTAVSSAPLARQPIPAAHEAVAVAAVVAAAPVQNPVPQQTQLTLLREVPEAPAAAKATKAKAAATPAVIVAKPTAASTAPVAPKKPLKAPARKASASTVSAAPAKKLAVASKTKDTAPAPKPTSTSTKASSKTATAAPGLPVAAKKPVAAASPASSTAKTAPRRAATASKSSQESEKKAVKSSTPPSPTQPIDSTSAVDSTASVSVPVKKSAVKFPEALTKSLQADKPGFPQVGGRPAFKAKTSPATGAKKRVRQ
ncbi:MULTISPECIES: phasin family protein [unclassified Undibacterium]|uniref:phasin family protein n=1 Tax=unclassified Undibacterium TaxID=2630295 RepID=UPI002AC90DB9|nr:MULTISPECIES: phasin family protein [unclassified Undibacterium]MEB0137572.1 phasin family protein [Undibacterium sp. CCC2.1]MEB0170573.1 phasin family protein [Undibacterium sp. CCC1.1]MEB0174514.1 phasin family protein [Undibacterium sp. CCC3.4]MEB0213689.1 phasin family protein [Undibacterium sp. 5I2]WPX43854.1 phasin family protein [Undibacterium sp. CCC3.4]